jgi:hypothetical protein
MSSSTVWNIIFEQGAEFQATVTITGWPSNYPALNTASDWRLRVAKSGETPYLTATKSNYITVDGTGYVGTIKIPTAVTAAFPCGAAVYDLDILFSTNTVVKRLISLGAVQVNGST